MPASSGATTSTLLTQNPGNPFTFTITLNASSSRGVIVWVVTSSPSGTPPIISGITVGSDTLAAISGASVTSTNFRAVGWGGLVSGTGSQTISITHNGLPNDFWAGFAIEGLSVSAIDNGTSTTNSGSPISLGLTATSNDLTTTCTINNGTGVPSTNRTSDGGDANVTPVAFDHAVNQTNPTHTWTTTGVNWGVALVAGARFAGTTSPNLTPSTVSQTFASDSPTSVVGILIQPVTP